MRTKADRVVFIYFPHATGCELRAKIFAAHMNIHSHTRALADAREVTTSTSSRKNTPPLFLPFLLPPNHPTPKPANPLDKNFLRLHTHRRTHGGCGWHLRVAEGSHTLALARTHAHKQWRLALGGPETCSRALNSADDGGGDRPTKSHRRWRVFRPGTH